MKLIIKYKKIFMLIMICICICTIALSISYRQNPTIIENLLGYAIIPFQKITSNVTNYFNDKLYFISNINKIENDNILLLEKISDLEEELNRLRYVDEQNNDLLELYNLDKKFPKYNKIGAYVVSRESRNWYDVFLIDKGTDHNIKKNMIVMANGGLVGRIVESGNNYSKVVSIIDDTSSVSAQSTRTGDIGYIRGDIKLMLEGLCKMEFIDNNAQIIEGEEIVTSNLSKIYPPGISIGVVRQIKTDVKGLNKYAIIEPSVNFKNINTVLIVNQIFLKSNLDEFGMEEN